MERAFIVVGLGFGDEGKGSVTDWLCREHEADLVVRYNGGAQAAHNVVLPDGRSHTFAQFGSGTFVPGVRTYLSRYMMVNPITMLNEERHLRELGIEDAFQRMYISSDALVTTPYHVAMNKLREIARGDLKHGSCGMGIGETRQYAMLAREPLRIRHLLNDRSLRHGLANLCATFAIESNGLGLRNHDEARIFNDNLSRDSIVSQYQDLIQRIGQYNGVVADCDAPLSMHGPVVFEGAQGVLLDEDHGYAPFNTWSKTTTQNAETLLKEWNWSGPIEKVGITRAYATRHGAGPLLTEDPVLTRLMPDDHNVFNAWQEDFRVGWLNLTELQYAIDCTDGIDSLAVTCLDRIRTPEVMVYEAQFGFYSVPTMEIVHMLETKLGVPVTIKSYGPTHEDKIAKGVKV